MDNMNLLGIDYGTKNIGLAKASTTVPVVVPFGIIDNTDHEKAITKLASVLKEENINTIIAGLPLGLDGSENKNTDRVRNFFASLKKEIDVPVEFITEVFSSFAGDRMAGGASRDEKSAMVILQSYFDKKI
jgi:putative Holliday junction resolvase